MPRHVDDTWTDYLGPGALSSLVAALIFTVLGLGIPILWQLRQVVLMARSDSRRPSDLILVLGRALENDAPSDVFRARLDHGATLWRDGVAPQIVITGGLTGRSTLTEAAAGKLYLENHGVKDQDLFLEDRSRHTLENLYNVRERAEKYGWRKYLVVSDALHLARAAAMARGFGLDATYAAAPGAVPSGWRWWGRAVREAIMLHWYHSGVLYSRIIRSKRNLARVT